MLDSLMANDSSDSLMLPHEESLRFFAGVLAGENTIEDFLLGEGEGKGLVRARGDAVGVLRGEALAYLVYTAPDKKVCDTRRGIAHANTCDCWDHIRV